MTHLTGCPRTLAALIFSHKHLAIYYYSVMLQQQILRRLTSDWYFAPPAKGGIWQGWPKKRLTGQPDDLREIV
jgi:hypothetical protein